MSNRKDPYYFKAKKDQYRSRAAYKLIEIQQRFSFFSGRENVLELGSSPGGWSQVISGNTRGRILAIDRSPQEPLDGVQFVRGDIFSQRIEGEIGNFLEENGIGCFDRIISDTMGKASGISHRDHAISVELGERVMQLADRFLCPGGRVLIKQFQGDMTKDFMSRHSRNFEFSKLATTKATRGGSSEVFIILTGWVRQQG